MKYKKIITNWIRKQLKRNPKTVHSIREWCNDCDIPINILEPEKIVHDRKADFIPPFQVESFEESRIYDTYGTYYVYLNRTEIRGYDGLIVLPDGTFPLDPMWWNADAISKNHLYNSIFLPKRKKLKNQSSP